MNIQILMPLVLATALALSGGEKKEAPPSEAQKAQIIREVQAVVHAMADHCQRLDADAAYKDCLDGPDFMAPGMDGTIADLKEAREGTRAFFGTLVSMRFTLLKETTLVVGPEAALDVYHYKIEATQKNGERQITDPATISLLLRKVGGAWKIVFYHESALPPKMLPALATGGAAGKP